MKGLISTAMANAAGNSTKLLKRAARDPVARQPLNRL